MALIKCYECDKEISDKAISCPNCGAPKNLDSNKNQGLRKEESLLEKNIKEEKEKVINNKFIEKESKLKENKISFKNNKTFQFIKKYIFGYGRISRKEYRNLYVIIVLIIFFIFCLRSNFDLLLLPFAISFALILPLFGNPLVRLRYHDSGVSFWINLISFFILIPSAQFLFKHAEGLIVIKFILVLIFLFLLGLNLFYLIRKGDDGKNKYGDNPDDKYIGDYVNGKKNGIGIYIFANGEKYEGEFKDDMFHGNGTYYYLDGTKKEGVFENDELIKETK